MEPESKELFSRSSASPRLRVKASSLQSREKTRDTRGGTPMIASTITACSGARFGLRFVAVCALFAASAAHAQLTDLTQTPNAENAGIVKSLEQQIGTGVGNTFTVGSSTYIIKRDP